MFASPKSRWETFRAAAFKRDDHMRNRDLSDFRLEFAEEESPDQGHQGIDDVVRFLEGAFTSLGNRGREDSSSSDIDVEAPHHDLSFDVHFRIFDVALIALRNAVLNILTLTLFRFWARTRVRRYLWSRTSLLGDPLEYVGSGIEIFFGFLLIVALLVVPLVSISVSLQLFVSPDSPIAALYAFIIYLGVFYLYGVARYRARRYRLSRTVWRGIRFGLKGSWILYGARTLVLSYLTGFSLFLVYPIQRFVLMKDIMSHTTIGDRQLRFEGSASKLYPSFALAWVLSIVGVFAFLIAILGGLTTANETGVLPFEINVDDLGKTTASPKTVLILGVASLIFYRLIGLVLAVTLAWYRAKEFRYFAECTKLDGLRFHFRASGLAVLWLYVGNSLLLLFTLGLALPLAQMRTFKFFFKRLTAEGTIDIESIQQGDSPYPYVGEGLAEFFEIGSV